MWTEFVFMWVTSVLVCGDKYDNIDSTVAETDLARVQVSQGWLQGELLDLVTGDGRYYSFKGIPYARPPLGKLRFKAPEPPLSWEGIRSATSHGPECMQHDTSSNDTLLRSEDCLFLNVYTKDLTPTSPQPVMVFIHGGGFLTGSGNDKVYGPDFIVNRGVTLVTINYRLDAIGFLCLDTEDVPGNAGLKDQVAALRWVKENIKKFGGDDENITIFGESSGGASTAYHMLSPMSKGLFKRAISMSGVPFCDWALPHHPVKRAFVVGKLLGKETEDPKELLEYLQSLPADKLVGVNPTIFAAEEYTSNIFKLYHFTAVTEKDFGQERFLSESPLEITKKGKMNEVDVLIGHTNEEALIDTDDIVNTYAKQYSRYPELLVPSKILIQSTPDTALKAAESIRKYYFGQKSIGLESVKEFSRYLTESGFIYDVQEFAARLPKPANKKLFFYVFSCFSERNYYGSRGAKYGMQGASHLDDLLYLFDPKEFNWKVDKSSREYKLVDLVNAVFTNFAKYGTPTPDESLGVKWPEYHNDSRQYVEIGDRLVVGNNYKADVIRFWRSVFDEAGVEFH
uniref:Carboxylic ester hydrolase n=1 Tax=Ectropis obliqua TaxID=248899 RepID=A0A2U3T8L4_ECTOB|nr:putative antennal esterase CXE29 [Ectropis obliqua]